MIKIAIYSLTTILILTLSNCKNKKEEKMVKEIPDGFFSYSINHVNYSDTVRATYYRPNKRLSALLFTSSNSDSPNGIYVNPCGIKPGVYVFGHSNGCNINFADGHGNSFITDHAYGNVTITESDTINHILSATFNGKLFNTNDPTLKVKYEIEGVLHKIRYTVIE